MSDGFVIETLDPAELASHPRNYRGHPEDQRQHLCRSLEEHGQYRNVVIAQDGTILAGHGVVEAALALGWPSLSCVRLPIASDSPAALKVLIGDNEIEHLAEQDDRLLTELLKEIGQEDPLALLGTGYDAMMLANLAMVTRPASEIRDFDAAAHWAGMPEYNPDESEEPYCKAIFNFRSDADRAAFFNRAGLSAPSGKTSSQWWPARERQDLTSLLLEEATA